MRTAYVAGPYRGATQHKTFANLLAARDACRRLTDAGWCVISPHAEIDFIYDRRWLKGEDHKHIDAMCEEWIRVLAARKEYAYEHNLAAGRVALVTYCDYSDSVGTLAEVELARMYGLPVLTLDEATK